jgi:hypothetical protein
MFKRLFATLVASMIASGFLKAEDPPAPATTTSPSDNNSTATTHYHKATDIITGKVVKKTDTSITVKVSFHVGGGKAPHLTTVGHVTGGWLPHVVPGVGVGVTSKRPRTIVQTMTIHVGETPPVKVVTDGANPTRTTGSYSDVHVGDTVMVGSAPITSKDATGKSQTQVQVTGIDVLHHPGAATTATKPPKN